MKNFSTIFFILFFVSNIAHSDLYKHVDQEGNVTYSNIRSKDAKTLDLPSITVVPSVKSETVDSIIKRRKESSLNKKQRDTIEKQIYEEEERLSVLKKEYKDGTPDRLGSERNYQRYLDRVERLKGEIAARENNLNMLQRNLQNLPNPSK